MNKNTRLSLEKEKLRLKIKQQEYEIKKTMLDLKDRYHPLNVALNMAGDYLAGTNEQLATQDRKIIKNNSIEEKHANGIPNFLGQIIALFQNYIELANEVAQNKRKQIKQPESDMEEYVIGRDDL